MLTLLKGVVVPVAQILVASTRFDLSLGSKIDI